MIHIESEERGAGFPVLLVMGLGYGRWAWEPLVDPLAESFRVVWYDNRGIGGSDKPAGPYTAADLAEDAVQVLDERGIERAHVVGTSLGGMVAQELALSHPERVEKLALLCTTAGGAGGYPFPEQTVRLMAEAPALAPDVAMRRFVENAVSARGELVETLVARRAANPPDPAGWQAQAAASATFDAWERLAAIDKETLVLAGDEDNVVDWRNSQLLAERIPNARLQVFPGVGHLFFWERPAEVAAALEEFLA
ncbi:MAG TPA: alpha/beta hydrolase [Gaiellaceae bacterium]|nr:alpha/beta hydrolase [Gaiellaceae bacterium]